MKRIEVWGTIEYRKFVDVPDDCITYEDVFDEATYNLSVGEADLGDIVDVNVVYDEPEENELEEEEE